MFWNFRFLYYHTFHIPDNRTNQLLKRITVRSQTSTSIPFSSTEKTLSAMKAASFYKIKIFKRKVDS